MYQLGTLAIQALDLDLTTALLNLRLYVDIYTGIARLELTALTLDQWSRLTTNDALALLRRHLVKGQFAAGRDDRRADSSLVDKHVSGVEFNLIAVVDISFAEIYAGIVVEIGSLCGVVLYISLIRIVLNNKIYKHLLKIKLI